LETIYASESDLQAQQIPEAKESLEFQQRLEAIESALDKLESQGGSQVTSWVRDFRSNRIPAATMHINNLPAAIVWLTDAKAAGAKLIDFLATLSAPGTG
jgi:hypothetical protein